MNTQDDANRGQDQNGDIRDIPKWTRRYAQHRCLGGLVFFLIVALFYVSIGGLTYLAALSYKTGHIVCVWLCVSALLPILSALIWISVPWWGGKRFGRFLQHLYRKEGSATTGGFGPEDTKKWPRWALAVLFGFIACVVGHMALGMFGYLSREYMQPVSAIYCVPFLGFLIIWGRLSLLGWLYPFLYGLHAILYVAGAPIRFTGHWEGLNIFFPVLGYGILCALVGHIYSRFALRKLKKLTHVTPEE